MNTLLVVVDTETTGTDAEAELCQLASVLHFEDQVDTYEFCSYANPGRPITPEATAVNGITDALVAPMPPAREVALMWWADVLDLAGTRPGCSVIFAGHNVGFDLRVISRHIPLHYFTRKLDTLRVAWRMHPEAQMHKLEYLYREHLGLSSERTAKAHDARCDCWMVFEMISLWKRLAFDGYEHMVQELRQPVIVQRFPYGKYKGELLSEVPIDYLEYMRNQIIDIHDDVGHSIRVELVRRGPEMPTVMTFGKHRGTPISELPRGYVRWLRESDVITPSLTRALDHHFG